MLIAVLPFTSAKSVKYWKQFRVIVMTKLRRAGNRKYGRCARNERQESASMSGEKER